MGTYVRTTIQITPAQLTWLKAHPDFNFSGFVRLSLTNEMDTRASRVSHPIIGAYHPGDSVTFDYTSEASLAFTLPPHASGEGTVIEKNGQFWVKTPDRLIALLFLTNIVRVTDHDRTE